MSELSQITVTYFVTAQGASHLPRLDLIIFELEDGPAIEQAKAIAKTLFDKGYWSFTLFKWNGVRYYNLAQLSVTARAPVVTII